MLYFTIAGTPSCPFFGHALYVGYFLEERLPNFNVVKVEKEDEQWENWVRRINKKNNWLHIDSPLIWKELTMKGGKPYYIGGLSEFWEYCYDFYGLESILHKNELQKIVDDSMQYFRSEQSIKEKQPERTSLSVCIHGGDITLVWMFLSELFLLKEVNKTDYLKIKLSRQDYLDQIKSAAESAAEMPTKSLLKCYVVDDLQAGLIDTDLLIIFGDFTRGENEEFKTWLDRNHKYMVDIAESINKSGKSTLRVVIAMHGPVCFNATILTQHCKNIPATNIVAVTADIGYETLSVISEELKVPLSTLGAPPIWGFVGINHTIDIDHIIQKYNIYRPYERAAKIVPNSSLVSGTHCTELRYLNYLTFGMENLWQKYQQKQKVIRNQIKRTTTYPKIRATLSLLENWYKDGPNDNIISLGICTDGSSTIPAGINISMPAYLEKGVWKRVKNFPRPENNICSTEDFQPFIYDILSSYDMEKTYFS